MSEKQLHNGQRVKDKKGRIWFSAQPYIKEYGTNQEMAKMFISLVTIFNGIRIGHRELEFLSYMMMRDGIIAQLGKKLYREQYNVPQARVDNMISQLKKKKILIKGEDGKVRMHPKIVLPFKDNDNFIFQFRCGKKDLKIK